MSETGEVAPEPTPVTDTDTSTTETTDTTSTSTSTSTESAVETPAAQVQEKTVEPAVEPTPEPTSTSEPPANTSSASTSEEPVPQPIITESAPSIIITEATPTPDIDTLSPASTAVLEAELAAATELSANHVIPRRLTAEEAAILVTSTPEIESDKEKEMGATVPDDVDENVPVTIATPVDIVVTEPDEISTTRSLDAVTDTVPAIDPILLAQASDAVIETSQRVIDAHASPRDHVPDVSAAVDAAQAAGVHPASLIDTARTSLISEEDEMSDPEPIDEVSEDEDDIRGSTTSLPPLHSGTHTKKGSLEVMVSEPKSPTSSTTATSTTSTPIIEPTSTPPITFITPSVTPDLENESDVADDSDDPKPAITVTAAAPTIATSTSTSTSTTTSTSTSSLRTSSAPSTPAGTPVVSPIPVSVAIPGLPLAGRGVSDSSATGLAVGGASSRVVTTPSKPTHTPSISSVTLPSGRNHSPSIFSSLLGRGSRDPSPSQRSASPSPDGSPRVPLCSNCVSKPYKNGLCKLHYQNLKREAEQKSRELKDHAKREQKAEKDRQKAAEKQAKLLKKSQKDSKKVGHQSAPAALGGKSATDGLSIQDALLIELRDAWKKATKVVFKDVPRLAKRTTVQVHVDGLRGLAVDCGRRVEIVPVETTTNDDSKADAESTTTRARETTATAPTKTEEGGVSLLASTSAPTTKTVVGKDVTVWEAVTNVVLAVAKQLEPADKYDAAAAKFAKLGVDTDSASDFQGLLEDLFTSTLGLDSPTFAVFRAVHQSILFPPIFHLKTKLYNQLGDTMKDVRRDDGWTIHIYIGEAVYVTHTRWEQSMNDEKSPEHFEVQWQVRLSFDRKMQDLRASFLRIQELAFHDQINPERKKQIQGVLRGGGYMV